MGSQRETSIQNRLSFCTQRKIVLRTFLLPLTLALFMGCSEWPPETMRPPVALPPSLVDIDPWISKLLDSNVDSAKQLLDGRLATHTEGLEPLIRRMNEFVPCQVSFSSGIGHVRCLRRYKDSKSGKYNYDVLYIAQPLPSRALGSRLNYFDEAIRPLAEAFLQRFAGSGEEMEGMAGQFTFRNWPAASDFTSRDASSFGDWRDARLFYAAMNGDSVFIKPDGSTAWHVLETDTMIAVAPTLEQFIVNYADFRESHDVFDSWAYRAFIKERAK